MKKITFIISIVVLVLLLGMSTVFADNSFLPNDGELPVIRAVYEDGGTIYKGDRVTLYSDYYLPRALVTDGDQSLREAIKFDWYKNDVDSNVGGIKQYIMGNYFMVDTSQLGTYYYYYVIRYLVGGVEKETVTSDTICVTVEEKKATANPLSTMLTPAEASGWRETTSSAELIDWYETVAENSDNRVKMFSMGKTAVGHKDMPLVIMSYPEAPESPDEVDPDKAVVLVNCNIHSGEVEGKEAMMIFAREVALGEHDDLLEDLVILLIPNFNADGNDMLGKRRIGTQYMPKMVGTRFTGALINPYLESLGITNQYNYNSETHNFYNINRDMTKLDTVEARAAINVMNVWDPVIFIDAHATNGSFMRHAITYNWGLHPNTDPDVLAYNRDVFCKNAVGKDSYLFEVQGKVAVPYGNFSSNRVNTAWATFEDLPRYTTNYAGLRNRLAILLEVYSHDPYTVRVDTQYACIYGSLLAVQEDKDHIKELIAQADARSLARAVNGTSPTDKVALNSTMEYLYDIEELLGYEADPNKNYTVISYAMTDDEGDRCGTLFKAPETYTVPYNGLFVPKDKEDMGAYYLIDSDCAEAIQLLDYHGIEYSRLSEPVAIAAGDFKWYNITKRNQIAAPTTSQTLSNFYEGHLRNGFSGTWTDAAAPQVFPAGTYVVSTAQSRGSLAALLLEPACVDGAVTWNFFDDQFDVNNPQMVRSNYPCTTSDATPLTIGMPIFKVAAYDEAQKPIITTQPQGQAVYTHANPTLSVAANVTDDGDLSYQWYKNSTRSTTGGEAIAGATNATYAPPTSSSGTVYYYVVVTNTNTNHLGSTAQTISDIAELRVNRVSSSGGGSSATNYNITTKTAANGTIKVDNAKATAGSKVNITVTADPGYEIEEITVEDSTGKEIKVTKNSDGTYSFTMPSTAITISATFKEIAPQAPTSSEKVMSFVDVRSGDWFYQPTHFVFSKGLFTGTTETTFSPSAPMTRGMLVTVLWRLANKPDVSKDSVFSDVSPGAYYEKAAVWAADHGIASGYSTVQFAPHNNATREQMAVILYNYAKYMGYDVSATAGLNSFIDSGNISPWATGAMQWAVAKGLIGGKGNGMLDPTGNVTRAEVAAILMRFVEDVAMMGVERIE